MDESNPKIPTYEALFEVKHNDDQALMLFEDYLCYRSLQDVLSLRTSRWEQLVQTLYPYIKDVADNECKRWLCLVNLAIHVREGITRPNEQTYSSILKCLLENKDLFEAYKTTTEELTLSIGCYLLLIMKNKKKAENFATNQKVQELISAFPDFTDEQVNFMAGNKPHFILIKILDQLRSVVKKMQPPMLTELFDEYQCAAEEQQENSESSAAKKTSDTAQNITCNEPGTDMEMNSPRRSARSTPSKYRSKLEETTSPAKLPSSSTTMAVCESPSHPTHVENGSRVDGTPEKSTPTEGQGPSRSPNNSPAAAPRHRYGRGLRDLKIVGDAPVDWSSDEDDEPPPLPKPISKEAHRRQSLELPKKKRFKLRTSRHPWTETEEKNLLKGVETLGLGQWSAILKSFYFAPYRDNVSLKDKWRNMLKNKEVPKKYW